MDLILKKIGKNWNTFEEHKLKQKRGLKTGYSEIDKAIIGLPGLVTLWGDTGCGKSTFMLHTILHNAQNGVPVIMLDKENGLYRTRLRTICNLANLTPAAVESGNFYDGEEAQYNKAVDQLQSLPIYYINEFHIDQVEEAYLAVKKAENADQVLIVIDSLHRLDRYGNEPKEAAALWMGKFNNLKLKYENHLTLVVISEKSKGQYGQASTRGGKDSGSIEYLSEMIFDLYKDRRDPQNPITIVDCLKNRDGSDGMLMSFRFAEPYCYKLQGNKIWD